MLSHKKYIKQVLIQKTYTPAFLTGKKEKNLEQMKIYLVENAHEPIIDRVREMKENVKHTVQMEQTL